VDDDQPTREVLRLILEDADYAVGEAATADAALDLLRASSERVVALFDHLMPGTDGLQALHQIAADARLATQHSYVLITADVRPLTQDDVTTLTQLRCPVVRKPFDLDALLGVVAQQAAALRDA
jgi:CheY-like chemotaxis protein